eukprot:6940347-Prorocentrum_lima.AAC.1
MGGGLNVSGAQLLEECFGVDTLGTVDGAAEVIFVPRVYEPDQCPVDVLLLAGGALQEAVGPKRLPRSGSDG